MIPQKIILTDFHRNNLKELRKMKKIGAEELSTYIGHHKSWLGQIERGRLQSIKTNDLIALLSALTNYSQEAIINNGILVNFIEHGQISVDTNLDIKGEIDEMTCRLHSYLDSHPDSIDDVLFDLNHFFICLSNYSGVMRLLLSQSSNLQEILDNYSSLSPDEYFSYTSNFINSIKSLINDEVIESEKIVMKNCKNT